MSVVTTDSIRDVAAQLNATLVYYAELEPDTRGSTEILGSAISWPLVAVLHIATQWFFFMKIFFKKRSLRFPSNLHFADMIFFRQN